MTLAIVFVVARRGQQPLRALERAQAFMDDFVGDEAQVTAWLKIDAPHRVVQILQALLDHRNFMVDIAE
ncbi:hypothetical protein D3C79_1091270 [compost metagenome]